MKALMTGTGLAILLLMPASGFAQQSQQPQQPQQQTDDQKSFNNNVQAEPTTKKRQDIIRSEGGQAQDNKATVGEGSKKQ